MLRGTTLICHAEGQGISFASGKGDGPSGFPERSEVARPPVSPRALTIPSRSNAA